MLDKQLITIIIMERLTKNFVMKKVISFLSFLSRRKSIIFVIRKPLLKDKGKQRENFIKPGDREKGSKTWSLPAKPGELTGL